MLQTCKKQKQDKKNATLHFCADLRGKPSANNSGGEER